MEEEEIKNKRLGTNLGSKGVSSLLTGLLVEEGFDFVFSRSQVAFVLKKVNNKKSVKEVI